MTSRIPIVLGLVVTLVTAALAAAQDVAAQGRDARDGAAAAAPTPKRAIAAARLLVPFFEVDTANPAGATTFFSVRNEITQPVEVRFSFYAPDSPQSPFHTELRTLAPKAVRTVNVRSQPNLIADADGIARGYAMVETVLGQAVIQGDYFQLTPDEAFATGSRLVNIDPASEDNDLCSVLTIRFLNGGGFDGGTEFTFWMDLDVAPQGTDVLSYVVYNEAGSLIFFSELSANEVALRKTAAELTSSPATPPVNFGAIEFQFNDGVRGHISAAMNALGLYSVGLEAACGD